MNVTASVLWLVVDSLHEVGWLIVLVDAARRVPATTQRRIPLQRRLVARSDAVPKVPQCTVCDLFALSDRKWIDNKNDICFTYLPQIKTSADLWYIGKLNDKGMKSQYAKL